MSSKTVDNRVVNMQFNNAQFEQGVKQTISSLDELKKSLDLNTSATSSLNNVQKAFDSFSVKNIEQNLQSLTDRFSNFGIVGMTVIQNLTNEITNFVKSKVSSAYNQILTGGWNRASSIASARFTLQGLFANDVDGAQKVETAMNSAMDAVTGTSYTMASAASAASQLAASGVDVGDEMYNTLRSIAGVASMTGDSFDSIAHIFTTVAGNGRLMGMQLTQLSMHGLNVAATLGKSLGKSEAEIRDMVSKGEIDFKTFSKAMQDAFGDQAAKANTTFSGTMDNIKSQLSKIGEIFGTGIIENKSVIAFLNHVREALGGIKDIISGRLKNSFADMMTSISKIGSVVVKTLNTDGFKKFIDIVGTAMDKITEFNNTFIRFSDTARSVGVIVDKVYSVSDRQARIAKKIYEGSEAWGKTADEQKKALGVDYKYVKAYLDEYTKAEGDISKMSIRIQGQVTDAANTSTKAMSQVGGSAEEAAKAFNPIQVMLDSISTFGAGVSVIWSSVKNGARSIGEALTSVYGFSDFIKDVKFLGESFTKVTKIFELTDERSEKLKNSFRGLFIILDFIKRVYKGIAQVLINSFGPIASDVVDIILSMFSAIGKLIVRIDKWEKKNRILASSFELISKFIGDFYKGIKEVFTKVSKLDSFKRLTNNLKEASNQIGDKLGPAFKKLIGWLNEVADGVEGGNWIDKAVNIIDKALKLINKAFDRTKSIVTGLFDLLFKKPESSDNGMVDNATEGAKKASGLFDVIKGLGDKSKGLVDVTSDIINSILDIFVNVSSKLLEVFNNVNLTKVALIAIAAGFTTMMFSISKFINKGSNLLGRIVNVFNNKKTNIVGILNALVKVILALTVALFVLSSIPADKLKTSATILIGLMAGIIAFAVALVFITKVIKEYQKTSTLLSSMSRVLISFGLSIMFMALALKTLSEIEWKDWEHLAKSLLSLVAVVATLTAAMLIFMKFGAGAGVAANMVSMGIAVYLLVESLDLLAHLDLQGVYGNMVALLALIGIMAVVVAVANRIKPLRMLSVLLLIGNLVLLEFALQSLVDFGVGIDDIKKNIDKFIVIFATLWLMTKMINSIKSDKKSIKKVNAITNLINSLWMLAIAIWILAKLDPKAVTRSVIAISTVIAILTACVKSLSKSDIKPKKLEKVVGSMIKLMKSLVLLALAAALLGMLPLAGIVAGIGAVAALVGIMSLAINKLKDVDGRSYKNLKQVVKLVRAFAVAMLLITVSMLALVLAIGTNYEGLAWVTLSMCAIMLTIAASIYTINDSLNNGGKVKTKLLAELAIFLSGMVLIIAAMALLVAFTTNPIDVVTAGIVIITVMIALVYAIEKLSTIKTDVKINILYTLITLIVSVIVIAESISLLSKTIQENELWSVAAAIGVIALIIGIIVGAVAILSKLPSGTSSGLFALDSLIVAIAVIALSLKTLLLGGIDIDSIKIAALGIISILLTLSIAMVIINSISTSVTTVAVMITIIALIAVIAITLKPIANGIEALSVSLAALMALGIVKLSLQLLAFALVGVLLAPVLLALGIGAIILAAGLGLLAAGIGLTGVSIKVLSKGLKSLEKVKLGDMIIKLTAFAVIGTILVPLIASLGSGVIVLGAGMLLLGSGVFLASTGIALMLASLTKLTPLLPALAVGIKMVIKVVGKGIITIGKSLGLAFVAFFEALVSGKDAFIDALNIIVDAFIDIVTVGVKAVVGIIEAALTGIIDFIGDMAEPIMRNIIKIFKALAVHSEEFGYYGAQIIHGFITGLINWLEEHIDEIADNIVKLINILVDSIIAVFKALFEYLKEGFDIVTTYAFAAVVKIKNKVSKEDELVSLETQRDLLEDLIKDRKVIDEQGNVIVGVEATNEQIDVYKSQLEGVNKEIENYKDAGDRAIEGMWAELDEKRMKKQEENLDKVQEDAENTLNDIDADGIGDDKGTEFTSGFADSIDTSDLGNKVSSWITGSTNADEAGESAGDEFVRKVTQKIEASKIPDNVINDMLTKGWKWSDDGKHLEKEISAGYQDAVEHATDGVLTQTDLYDQADEVIKTLKDKGAQGGKQWLNGIEAGVKDSVVIKKIESGVISVGNLIDKKFRLVLDEHSPSRKGYEAGAFYFEGVDDGLIAAGKAPVKTSEKVANTMIKVFGSTLASIYENINNVDGLNPTITPVVDTSNVEMAGKTINDIFANNTLGIGAISANTAVSFNNANENNLALQVAELTKQVNKLAETDYSSMLEGVNINVDASTRVDGTPLRQMASTYTIEQIDESQRGLILATGGRV